VEKILDQREVEGQLQFYVKWKNFSENWNTWEPIDNLLDCFDLVLEFQEKHHIIKDSSISVVDTKKSKLARKEALKIVKKAKKLNSSDNIKRALQKHAAIIVNHKDGDISFVNDSLNLSVDTSFVNNAKSAKSPKSPKSPKSQKLTNSPKSPKSPKLTNSPKSPKSPKCKSSLTTFPNSKKLTGTTAISVSTVKRIPKKPSKLEEFYSLSNVKSVKVSGVKVSNGSPKKTVSGKSDDVQTLLKIPNLVNTKDGRQTIVNITSNKELDETQVIPKKSDSKTSEASKSKTKNVTKKTIKTLKTTEKNIKVKKRGNLLSVKLKPMKKKEKKDVNSITSNLSGSKDTDVMLQQTPMNNSPVKGKPEKQNISGEKKKQTNSAKDKEVKKKVNKKITIENLESNVTKTKVTKTKSVKSDGEVKKKMKKNGKKEKENKGLKRKLDQIEIIDTESDDDDNVIVKYSISPNSKILKTGNSLNKAENVSTSQIEIPRNLGKELSKKTLQVKVKPMNHTDASSHMKKMRLIDTMKSNPGFSKSGKIRNTILLHIIYSSLQLS
jgi:hypothetical protein